MAPGTTTWPTVAPSNTHLRLHLGLVIPSNANIRVANETRSVTLFIANMLASSDVTIAILASTIIATSDIAIIVIIVNDIT